MILPEAIPVSDGSRREKWREVAEGAADAYLRSHPGEAQRASSWKKRCEPWIPK